MVYCMRDAHLLLSSGSTVITATSLAFAGAGCIAFARLATLASRALAFCEETIHLFIKSWYLQSSVKYNLINKYVCYVRSTTHYRFVYEGLDFRRQDKYLYEAFSLYYDLKDLTNPIRKGTI